MSAWFCYERDFGGRWCPVVHHMQQPKAKKDEEHRLAGPWAVPDDCVGQDGHPMLGALQRRFPVPKQREGA